MFFVLYLGISKPVMICVEYVNFEEAASWWKVSPSCGSQKLLKPSSSEPQTAGEKTLVDQDMKRSTKIQEK